MKIVFIAIKGTQIIGGIETYTVEVGRKLVKQGHEVIVYTMKHLDQPEPYELHGMKIIPLAVPKSKTLAKLTLTFLASFHQFRHKNVDVLHYHAIGPSLFSFIPKLAGRRTVVQSHGHEWNRSNFGRAAKLYFKVSEYLTFLFADRITAVSKGLKRFYEEKYQRSVEYLPNGVNSQPSLGANLIKQHGVEGQDYILFLGRISREKGIQYLIEAYQRMHTDKKLVIVGMAREGDVYMKELKEQAKNNPNILFPGSATGELWREWYSNASVFVLPSESEGLPIALLEAMSFGNCCLASDIEPNIEALGTTGLTFKSMDVESLYNGLKHLLAHPEEAQCYAKMAYHRARTEFAWDNICDELINFYNGQPVVIEKVKDNRSAAPDAEQLGVKFSHHTAEKI